MALANHFRARPVIGVVLLTFLVCAVSLAAPAQTAAGFRVSPPKNKLARWVGKYKFSEPGTSPAGYEYTIDICDTSGRTYVSIVSEMEELQILAGARERRGRVNIFFDANGVSDREKGHYHPGDLLLTLQRKRNHFRLRWGLLRPEANGNHKPAFAEKLPAACGPQPPAE